MLASLSSVLAWAEENGCAAAAFDTPNLELLLAAIGAAEHRGEPVIIQHAQLHEEETSIDVIGPIMVARAEASRVPVCVMLDHGEDMDYVRRALDLGFSAVMIDGSQLPYEENVALTLGAVELAREYGADVEAEIGFTTGHEGLENADDDRENVYTDPDEAARFVADTGIDALAARYAASCSSSIAMTSPPVASCRTVPGRWSCPRQRAPLREASLVFVQARNARLSRMSARR